MTTCRLTGTLTVGATTVELDEGTRLTLDQGWSPYAKATAVVPFTQALFDATDPRDGDLRATLDLDQAYYEATETLDDAAAAWTTETLDDLATLWAGLTLDQVADLYGDRWGNATWVQPKALTADLGIRSRNRDHVRGTIALGLASDELLAQDVAGNYGSTNTTVAALFADVLGALLGYAPGDYTVDLGVLSEAAVPVVEASERTTSWDALVDPLKANGLRPWCDIDRTWRVIDPASATPPATVSLTRVTEANDTTDRDGEWADAVLVASHYTLAGAEVWHGAWAFTTPGVAHRVHVEEIDLGEVTTVPPLPAADPAAILRRVSGLGRVLTVTAMADLDVRPGVAFTAGAPSLPDLSGQVETVTFDLAGAQMTLTTRDTITEA